VTRDMDLIRRLLLYLEGRQEPAGVEAKDIAIGGYDWPVVQYHLNLLSQAGFLNGEVVRSKSTPARIIKVIPFDLTWKGHEFIATVRDEEIWGQTKRAASQLGASSIDILSGLAKAYINSKAKAVLGSPIDI